MYCWVLYFFFTRLVLSRVNSRFRDILKLVHLPLPEIHVGSSVLEYLPTRVCVRKLVRTAGSGSGLCLRIRKIIKDRRWINAWLTLRQVGISWYRVVDI